MVEILYTINIPVYSSLVLASGEGHVIVPGVFLAVNSKVKAKLSIVILSFDHHCLRRFVKEPVGSPKRDSTFVPHVGVSSYGHPFL
jgi:hypothetical protein